MKIAEELNRLCEFHCSAEYIPDWEHVVFDSLIDGKGVLLFGRDPPPRLSSSEVNALRAAFDAKGTWPVFAPENHGRDTNTGFVDMPAGEWASRHLAWRRKQKMTPNEAVEQAAADKRARKNATRRAKLG